MKLQSTHEEAREYKINTAKFTAPHEINDEINQLHLEHLYTAKNIIISLFDLKSKIVPKDALNIYPNDFHTWIDNTGAIELSVWINHSKPLLYESMKKAKLDDTHPFWYTYKQTSNHIARKSCSALYTTEFLTWKIFRIHAKNTPLVDKLIRYYPSPPLWSFTLRIIHCFCPPLPDSPPRFFIIRLIPDRFGDFPT